MGGGISYNENNIYDLFIEALESLEHEANMIDILNHYNLIEFLCMKENLNDLENFHDQIKKYNVKKNKMVIVYSSINENNFNTITNYTKMSQFINYFYVIKNEPLTFGSHFSYNNLYIYKRNNECSNNLIERIDLYCNKNLQQVSNDIIYLTNEQNRNEIGQHPNYAEIQIEIYRKEKNKKILQQKKLFELNLIYLKFSISAKNRNEMYKITSNPIALPVAHVINDNSDNLYENISIMSSETKIV